MSSLQKQLEKEKISTTEATPLLPKQPKQPKKEKASTTEPIKLPQKQPKKENMPATEETPLVNKDGNANGKQPKKKPKGVKLDARNSQILEYQVHMNLIKHTLAADHFECRQYWCFTMTQAVFTAISSVLAFAASAEIFKPHAEVISLIVGSLSACVVLLQTVSGVRNYDKRSDRHRNVAVQLRDLRDDMVLMRFKLNVAEKQEKRAHSMLTKRLMEDGAISSGRINKIKKAIDDWHEMEKHDKDSDSDSDDQNYADTFDSIQKRYQQSLSGCASSVPLEISEAFHELNTNLLISETKENVKFMFGIYGHLNYFSVLMAKGNDILASEVLNSWGFPMFLPNSRNLVRKSMDLLKKHIKDLNDLYEGIVPDDEETGLESESLLTDYVTSSAVASARTIR
jgi:hypothetical protein